ncbi:RagB/SusD family nutrient uptake outer membrane protein [Labilibaculum antarcticum]|uniref:RagB/SusD family nutrient uptake outer membrane protein n=1 Tax=Labilibaculum antarcticum TaxID=1717717 RepID=A0A1Y1CQX9_9BACT|nr:RagB/SusD family nutrient uptake outer membrane protein [Labilibaculum antarcticum]BAX82393.1 RagB/SusD family nutrient uptake outer membrane protein [Labilibaculum antarcticum]
MNRIYLILFLVTIFLAGCSEEYLDRNSLTELADENFWTTQADAEMALAGCYSNLQSANIYDSDPWAGGTVRWDYMSDDGWIRWSWMQGGAMSRGEHSTNDGLTTNFWKSCYQSIVRCNRVIETVPTLGADVISETTEKQIIAEAKFVRALVYNLMSMTFENAPLITKLQTVEEAETPVSQKSEIVDFILTDLEDCVEDLPMPGEAEWGRATKGAGYALLARINLYNENWTQAASWSQKVIDLGYSLYPDFQGLFQNANEINDEVIFPVRFMRGPDEDGANFAGYWGTAVKNYEEVLPNLANDYFCTDGKIISESALYNTDMPSENRDPRFDASILSKNAIWRGTPLNTFSKTTTGYAQRKYMEEENSENHFDAEEDFYVFRLGEVLLMKAEALAESGTAPTEVFALINQLRDRESVQMPHVDQTEVDNYFGGSLVDMVRHERRIETAFEGLRYLDLKRWGILKERAIDYYMTYERPNNGKLSDRYWLGPQQLIWPIPQSEIDVNPSLVQHLVWQ